MKYEIRGPESQEEERSHEYAMDFTKQHGDFNGSYGSDSWILMGTGMAWMQPSLVGGLEHFLFFQILGSSSSHLTNSYFWNGWLNHQPDHVDFTTQNLGDFAMAARNRQGIPTMQAEQILPAFTPDDTVSLGRVETSNSNLAWCCFPFSVHLPSGKRLHNYGQSSFLMGKLAINGNFQQL